MKVKYCGITRQRDAKYAVELGVDALGFIFYPKSPRYIDIAAAALIASTLPPFITRVAVTVNSSDEEIAKIQAAGCFDRIQLHGDETPQRCLQLAPTPLIKAVGVPLVEGTECDAYPVQALLLDKASDRRGGTGEPIDWEVAAQLRNTSRLPVILSGGLNSENVQKAVEIVQPYGIDICSGIESEPGIKNHQRMKEFMQLCRV
ncbi:MAG: phosphoribosylanthranilate isomerase [Verrucomicrobiota bacterium]